MQGSRAKTHLSKAVRKGVNEELEEYVGGDDCEKLYSEKRRVALTVDLQ